jgi:hypothetical protein
MSVNDFPVKRLALPELLTRMRALLGRPAVQARTLLRVAASRWTSSSAR